jgi:hypothetical protein
MALGLPETFESVHMGHPDFRVAGRIFATLGYPDASHGMVKLSPEQQRAFVRAKPGIFAPARGLWGARGATTVRLASARIADLRPALYAAWFHSAQRRRAKDRNGEE